MKRVFLFPCLSLHKIIFRGILGLLSCYNSYWSQFTLVELRNHTLSNIKNVFQFLLKFHIYKTPSIYAQGQSISINADQHSGIYPNVDQFRINVMILIGINRHRALIEGFLIYRPAVSALHTFFGGISNFYIGLASQKLHSANSCQSLGSIFIFCA